VQGRQRWIALAKSFDVQCEAIVFKNDGPEVHAQRRFNSDARGRPLEYWQFVANLHDGQWVDPTLTEGFSNIYHISFAEITEGKVIL
jgi:hypothetical protein